MPKYTSGHNAKAAGAKRTGRGSIPQGFHRMPDGTLMKDSDMASGKRGGAAGGVKGRRKMRKQTRTKSRAPRAMKAVRSSTAVTQAANLPMSLLGSTM